MRSSVPPASSRSFALGLACLLILEPLLGQAPPPEPVKKLNIVIVEGDGAVNNIKQRSAREPIVQIEDENHRPVAGATVTFVLPQSGPGATFPGGARTLSVFTDQAGRARALGLRPNSVPGKFTIQVNASSQGLTSSAVVAQTNVMAAAAARVSRL